MKNDWVQQQQEQYTKLVKLRQQLFKETFSNVELRNMNLTDAQTIIQKQRKRLKINDKRITLDDLRLGSIKNGNNLYNLVLQNKAKIIKAQATQFQIKIQVQTFQKVNLCIEKGTLLLPADDTKSQTQTLIVRDQIIAQYEAGINNISLKTFCYNKQLSSPHKQRYLLGSVRCLSYQCGMSQSKVWEITFQKKISVQYLQKQLQKKDHKQYIAFTKKKVFQILAQWND